MRPERVAVVLLDHARVGDEGVRQAGAEPLGSLDVALGGGGPLVAFPVEAIDMEHGFAPGEAGQEGDGGVGGQEAAYDIGAGGAGMAGGEGGMDEGIEVLIGDGR